jgi:hypothetical protein
MAFVRAKKQGQCVYHYLVTTERQGGRVRQKTIAYLGDHPTLQSALDALPREIAQLREAAFKFAADAEAARGQMHPAWIERNGGEVPRRRRGGLLTASKLFSRYWSCREQAEASEQQARLKEAQLSKLHAACSAHNCAAGNTILGTTPKSIKGGLIVKWERHERERSKHGSKSYLSAVLVRSGGGIFSSLASLREDYYSAEESRWYQKIGFWKDVEGKLNAMRLTPEDRADVEKQVAETVRRPSEEEFVRYAQESKAFWDGLKNAMRSRHTVQEVCPV